MLDEVVGGYRPGPARTCRRQAHPIPIHVLTGTDLTDSFHFSSKPHSLRPFRLWWPRRLASSLIAAILCADEMQLQTQDLTVLASSRLQTIVWTSRVDEAEQFYGGVLNLPFKGKSHGALIYNVGGGDLRVSPVPSTQPSIHTVLGFAVSNLNAVVAALSVRGVKFERFSGFSHDETGVVRTPECAMVAWFRDPDGNLLSVVQEA